MSIDNIQYRTDSDIEFLFERPVGWSSACLDSTINYYLRCDTDDHELENDSKVQEDKS